MDKPKECDKCIECQYIGDGDFICDKNEEPMIVKSKWLPTENYNNCKEDEKKEMLEVGEYVRTKQGYIAQLEDFNEYLEWYYFDDIIQDQLMYEDRETKVLSLEAAQDKVVSHSKDIKKIIEEGDVLKYRVNNLSAAKIGEVKKHKDPRSNKEYLSIEFYSLEQIEILQIITKERFELESYNLQ